MIQATTGAARRSDTHTFGLTKNTPAGRPDAGSKPGIARQGAPMTTMTRTQRTHRNAASFGRQFGILHGASIPLTVCRTHEPWRVIDALRDFAAGETKNPLAFKYWTVLGGWHTYDDTRPGEPPETDSNADLLAALKGVNDFGDGVYVVMNPHPWLPRETKVPPLVQVLKDYARTLPETKKRIMLLVPPGTALPVELQNDITVIDFELPSFAELREVYDRTREALPEAKRPSYKEADVDRIIAAGGGMVAHEFEGALSRSFVTHRGLLPALPIETMAAEVLAVKVEAVKKTEVLEVMPVGNMSEVGGLGNLKRWIEQRRGCFSQEAVDYGIDPLKGIMLAGPPGTGKSLVSKAIAWALALPLIKFDVSRVFAGLVGASEARTDEALKMAEAMAPCVLFVDEIDKAMGGAHQGGGDSGVSKRVLGKLLTWLQENDKPIFCVFSANRVDDLPAELVRKGRLDEIFSVSVPNEAERRQVLEIHLRKRKVDPSTVDLTDAVAASDNYVPAEIEAAVKDAKVLAFNAPDRKLTGKMIADQLRLMTPLSKAYEEQFASMRTWSEKNARPANGDERDEARRQTVRERSRPANAIQPRGTGRSMEIE